MFCKLIFSYKIGFILEEVFSYTRGSRCFKPLKSTKIFIRCQQWKKSANKKTPLLPLPILERPNIITHTDLFGPMMTVDSNKKFVLCITNTLTKYTIDMAIASRNSCRCYLQGVVFKIQHSSPNSHGWWKRICEQTLIGNGLTVIFRMTSVFKIVPSRRGKSQSSNTYHNSKKVDNWSKKKLFVLY